MSTETRTLAFEESHWTHEPTGQQIATFVTVSPATGDRYLIHPPAAEFSGGEWHAIVERDYASLFESATSRLPGVVLDSAFDLTSAVAVCERDHATRIRNADIAAGRISADTPWTETHTGYRMQRLAKTDDGTETWEDMWTLTATDNPEDLNRSTATNPYRRVVRVETTSIHTPL